MSTTPDRPDTGGFLSPRPGADPSDRCYRCGKPTPLGVSLCAACNPGKVKAPSSYQLHATMLGGIVLGGILLLVGWRFLSSQGGPYSATIVEREMRPDGGPAIVVSVSNDGDRSGVANCRVTRDGAPRPDDPTYRTERVEPGDTVSLERTIPAPPITAIAYDLERMTVICT